MRRERRRAPLDHRGPRGRLTTRFGTNRAILSGVGKKDRRILLNQAAEYSRSLRDLTSGIEDLARKLGEPPAAASEAPAPPPADPGPRGPSHS